MSRDSSFVRPNRLRSGPIQPNTLRSATVAKGHDEPPPFGPNSDAVLALIARLARLHAIEAQRLTSSWKAIPVQQRARAHEAAQATAERSGRRDEARRAQEEALHWLDESVATEDPWANEGALIGRSRERVQLRREAFPAVLDAIAGTILADVLEPWAVDVLLGPWRELDATEAP